LIISSHVGKPDGRQSTLEKTLLQNICIIEQTIFKMDDILTILLLSLAMLVGCYLSGMIPLAISLSEVTFDSTEILSNVRSLTQGHWQYVTFVT